MRVIRPVTVTDAMLLSSNIAETDYAVWSGATTYALGDRRILTSTHRIYESIQAGNLNHDPAADLALATPLWWKLVGPTNKWAMFDGLAGAQSSHATAITIAVQPGGIDSVSFINLDAESLSIAMVDGATTVYSRTVDLSLDNVFNWYEYFFEPIIRRTDVVLSDLPVYSGATINISIASGGSAYCGEVVFGLKREIGSLRWAPKIGIIDYSRKEIDEFGNPQILKRRFSKRMSCDLLIRSEMVDEVHRLLTELRATPIVWAGSDLYDSTVVFGFFRDFDVVIEGRTQSKCSLTLEGMT